MISTTVHACTLIPQHTLLDCLFAMSIRMYEKKRYCRLHGHFEGVSDGNVSPDNHAIHRLPISSPTNSQHNHQGIVRRTRCYVGWIGQVVIEPSIFRRFSRLGQRRIGQMASLRWDGLRIRGMLTGRHNTGCGWANPSCISRSKNPLRHCRKGLRIANRYIYAQVESMNAHKGVHRFSTSSTTRCWSTTVSSWYMGSCDCELKETA